MTMVRWANTPVHLKIDYNVKYLMKYKLIFFSSRHKNVFYIFNSNNEIYYKHKINKIKCIYISTKIGERALYN